MSPNKYNAKNLSRNNHQPSHRYMDKNMYGRIVFQCAYEPTSKATNVENSQVTCAYSWSSQSIESRNPINAWHGPFYSLGFKLFNVFP